MTDSFIILTNQISKYIIPFLLVGIPFYGLIIKKIGLLNAVKLSSIFFKIGT